MTPWRPRTGLATRISLLALAYMLAAAALALWLDTLLPARWMAVALPAALLLPLLWYHARRLLAPAHSLFRALAGTVASYRDGDYGFGLSWHGGGELGELVAAHNRLGEALREQRLALVQRELLLDTMVQNTPVAMILVDPSQRVVHANIAARKMLGEGHRLEGQGFDDLLGRAPAAVREAFERGGDGMFTVGEADEEDIYHLSRRHFRLNGRRHELVLLRRGQVEKLPTALTTIEERARHLEGFIRDYARFAKLPAPRLQPVEWPVFLAQLRSQVAFAYDGPDEGIARVDAAQLEQALLNLLKNAHESGSPAGDVGLALRRLPDAWRIDVLDRGPGMNEAVLAHALLPFYSTKRHGTGLGLALAREIAEAHGGRIALLNREGGGLCVAMTLPG